MKLFFDTETTGKADFRAEPDAPHQPRLVQLGAILTDDDGEEMASLNFIIKCAKVYWWLKQREQKAVEEREAEDGEKFCRGIVFEMPK